MGLDTISLQLCDVPSSRLWRLCFLGKLPQLACWKLLQIYIIIIDGFDNKLLIFKEKTENVSMQDTCRFLWVICKRHLSLICIVPLNNSPIALSEACQQVKSGSNFIGLWLAKIFILGPHDFQAEIFCGQASWHILIHSKISTPHYDFLALFGYR